MAEEAFYLFCWQSSSSLKCRRSFWVSQSVEGMELSYAMMCGEIWTIHWFEFIDFRRRNLWNGEGDNSKVITVIRKYEYKKLKIAFRPNKFQSWRFGAGIAPESSRHKNAKVDGAALRKKCVLEQCKVLKNLLLHYAGNYLKDPLLKTIERESK